MEERKMEEKAEKTMILTCDKEHNQEDDWVFDQMRYILGSDYDEFVNKYEEGEYSWPLSDITKDHEDHED